MQIRGLYLYTAYAATLERLNKERVAEINQKLKLDRLKEDKIKIKKDKFNKLSNKRLLKAVKAIKLLKNLSNKRHYLSNKDELDMILKSCKKAININMKKYKKL